MLFDSFIIIDRKTKTTKIVALCVLTGDLEQNYQAAVARISELEGRLRSEVPPVTRVDAWLIQVKANHFVDKVCEHKEGVSNLGQGGYQAMVKKLREYIIDGWIIQAVPSQVSNTALFVFCFKNFSDWHGPLAFIHSTFTESCVC